MSGIPQRVKLRDAEWIIGTPIGGGGFASVYAASDGTRAAAAKFVTKEPGSERELLFEELGNAPNVVPVIDSGEIEDYFVLVMPRADQTLREYLDSLDFVLPEEEAIQILRDIATALDAVGKTVVHRDLKPQNILRLEGAWCLADFGIARYAEAATNENTRKHAMTKPYASPEQLNHERASQASDIYSFGVVAYEILEGRRPFLGPDFRTQHLQESPPNLTHASNRIASLVLDCLSKVPEARPTASNVLSRLGAKQNITSTGTARLLEANRIATEARSQAEAATAKKEDSAFRRRQLGDHARVTLDRILAQLSDGIIDGAPQAKKASSKLLNVCLLEATIFSDPTEFLPNRPWNPRNGGPAFDVIATSTINVRLGPDRDYAGRSHSLWFCDAQEEGVYRWFEIGFIESGLVPRSTNVAPFACPPGHANTAFSSVMGRIDLAWGPHPIDQGQEDGFVERWTEYFAKAALGQLTRPGMVIEQPPGSYRRS